MVHDNRMLSQPATRNSQPAPVVFCNGCNADGAAVGSRAVGRQASKPGKPGSQHGRDGGRACEERSFHFNVDIYPIDHPFDHSFRKNGRNGSTVQ